VSSGGGDDESLKEGKLDAAGDTGSRGYKNMFELIVDMA